MRIVAITFQKRIGFSYNQGEGVDIAWILLKSHHVDTVTAL